MKQPKKTRMTIQRRVILEVLRSTDSHPTADWVYHKVREELPNVSLGTIYRNLDILAKSGDILELNYSDTQSRYDGNPEPHYHFHCMVCNRVYDVYIDYLPQLDKDFSSHSGHQVAGHRLEFYGKCKSCQSKQEPS